jgi:hypothetical protein
MKDYLEFILEEVGDSMVTPYEYEKTSDIDLATYYKFVTEDQDHYLVRFYNMYSFQKKKRYIGEYQVEFVTGGDNYTEGDTVVVNKGRFFKVISTVISIIVEFMEEKDPKRLKINPVRNYKKDKRRKNIYIRYIERLLPNSYNYKKAFFGNSLYITKKD